VEGRGAMHTRGLITRGAVGRGCIGKAEGRAGGGGTRRGAGALEAAGTIPPTTLHLPLATMPLATMPLTTVPMIMSTGRSLTLLPPPRYTLGFLGTPDPDGLNTFFQFIRGWTEF
jgi:hypothetical protein